MGRSSRSLPLLAAEIITLTALGLVGNFARLTLFLNVDLIFGSVLTMIIVLRHGVVLGTVAGTVIASYTYVLWNHPYAIAIFALEALVVGLLHKRYKTGNIILYDAAFWLFLGTPLVFVFYRLIMGLNLEATSVIIFKQAINGVVNTTLAVGIAVTLGFLTKVQRHGTESRTSVNLHTALSTLMVALSTIPPLLLITILSRGAVRDIEQEVIDQLQSAAGGVAAAVSSAPGGYADLGRADDEAMIVALHQVSSSIGAANHVNTVLIGPDGAQHPESTGRWLGEASSAQLSELSSSVYLLIPAARRNVTVMDRWARTVAFTEIDLVEVPGWRVNLYSDYGRYQTRLHYRLLTNLSVLALLVFGGVFASTLAGRVVGRRIVRLSEASSGLGSPLGNLPRLPASSSPIREVAALERSFKEAGEAIRAQFRELNEAREEAQAADRSKSIFLANMSHEIRNPMNGVLGMLRLIDRYDLDSTARDYLRAAQSSAETLLVIINDILDLSKIRSGNMEISKQPFEIRPLVEQIGRVFEPLAKEKSLLLHWSVDESLPSHLVGAHVRIRQVLFNLIGNALKFTDQGEVRVDVCRDGDRDGGTDSPLVTFVVADTGSGIPQDELERVKDPFVQGESGYRKRAQGTGLGLTIVNRLTELMGGSLSISSRVGQGTQVRVRLPLKEPADTPVASSRASTGRDGNFDVGESLRLRVLAVDDNAINRLALIEELKHRGYRVTPAEDGSEALSTLRESDFDLVLMDIQMPVMDGIECTRRIRNGEAGSARDIPIIAITGYTLEAERVEATRAGIDAQISKPVVYEELERQIRTLFAAKDG